MNRFALLAFALAALPASAQDKPEIPKGEVTKYTFDKSKVFPGTVRDYWIYVPKQYDPEKPACVYVGQDGVGFKAPEAFDKLIAAKEMPVTIGVFVMHGRVKAQSNEALDRYNRSYEYDGLGDHYARFLLDELFPEVEKKTASAGPSCSRRTGTTGRSAGRAAARSAPSRRRGSGPTRSGACSARSAPTSACAAATTIRR